MLRYNILNFLEVAFIAQDLSIVIMLNEEDLRELEMLQYIQHWISVVSIRTLRY